MSYALRRLRALTLAVPIAFCLACGVPEPAPTDAAAGPQTLGRLEPERQVEKPIAGGEVHVFELELPAVHFLALEADSHDADVVVTLVDGQGTPLGKLESPGSRWGGELLLAVVEVAGSYRLEVRCSAAEDPDGRYELRLAELRPATDRDRLRAAAQKLHAEGLALSENNRAETNEQALGKFRQALGMWREAADQAGEARTLHWAGLMWKDLSRFQEAEESFRAALALWRKLGSQAEEAETLYRLGALYRLAGRFDDALETFESSLPLWRLTGDRLREAHTLYNQGLVYWQKADMQLALERYGQAAALYRALGERRHEAKTLNNVAVVHQMLGQTDRALEGFAKALAIHEELGDRKAQAATLNNLGWIYHRSLGESARAAEYFERALALAEELEDLRDQATYLRNLGRARIDLGDPQAALHCARRAYELGLRNHNPDGQCNSLLVMGLARMAVGETAAAVANFEEALDLSRSIGTRTSEAEALYRLAQAHRAEGALERSRSAVEQALAILEAVRTDVDSRSLKSTFLAFRRPYYELEVELLATLARRHPGMGYEGAALRASERARARSLLETLAEMGGDLRTGVDAATLAEEQELRRRIDDEELRRWSAGEEEQQAVAKRLRELLADLDTVEGRIRLESPRYATLARPQPLGLDEIRRQVLDPESLLLEYSLGDERSFLFAVTTSSIDVFELPARDVIEEAARTLYDVLTDRLAWQGPAFREQEARYRRAAAGLAALVLDPVAHRLAGRRLLIAPEGALHYIPFAALPAPGGEGGEGWRPLVVDHEVVHLPSASAIAELRRQLAGRPPPPRTLAVLADPVFQPGDVRVAGHGEHGGEQGEPALVRGPRARTAGTAGVGTLGRLRHSRAEAERIAAMVDPAERRVVLDFEASRALATSPELARYRFLHFATHGVLDSRTPELSGLVLSLVDEAGKPQDGFLSLHDIYHLELNADLVVLSACQTALGKAIRGEGLVGLVRGFFYAGARRVIASLWQIDDEATAVLMERLYRGLLRQGLAPAAALRQAQLEMLRGAADPAWQSPYYWAAFVLEGEWRPGR